MKQVYLWKKNGQIISHADLGAAAQLDGLTADPNKTVTEQEWEMAGSVAYIDDSNQIVLGQTPGTLAQQQKIKRLEEINAELTSIDTATGPRALRDIALAQKAVLGTAATKAIENLEDAESKAASLRTERAALVA
jgi:hypothetical protein